MNIELINKLWENTELKDKHWLWHGAKSQGYGVVRYNGSNWRIGKLSLCIYLKISYKGNWEACHIDSICQHKNCWNPLHLYNGSKLDNIKDAIINKASCVTYQLDKTHCPQGHEYTGNNLYIYEGRRYCRACHKQHALTYSRNQRVKNGR